MKIRLQPYRKGSRGAREIQRTFGVLTTTPNQIRKHGNFDVIINWGSTERLLRTRYINEPEAVEIACNKLSSYEVFHANEVPCPEFTADYDEALAWFNDGELVMARKLLRANGGRGIVMCHYSDGGVLPRAPLYTKYMKKADEYRVHVAFGKVIDVQKKMKRRAVDNEAVDYQVRNAANGWVFCRGGVDVPASVCDSAISAVHALGLSFGGVDVGYNNRRGSPCVYEVNTAPGVEGSTPMKYFEAMCEQFPQLKGGAFRRRRAQ